MSTVFVPTSTNGVLRVLDGSAVQLVHTCAFDKGDFKIGGLRKVLNAPVKVERRGRLAGYGLGDREYPSGSFSAWVPKLQNSVDGTAQDMVMASGLYAARLSTLSTSGNGKIPVLLDLHWHWEGSDAGGTDTDLYLADCDIKIDSIEESAEGYSISFSFEVWGKIYLGTSRSGTEYAAEAA